MHFEVELKVIEEEEREFQHQYDTWLSQYQDWKEKNKSKGHQFKCLLGETFTFLYIKLCT